MRILDHQLLAMTHLWQQSMRPPSCLLIWVIIWMSSWPANPHTHTYTHGHHTQTITSNSHSKNSWNDSRIRFIELLQGDMSLKMFLICACLHLKHSKFVYPGIFVSNFCANVSVGAVLCCSCQMLAIVCCTEVTGGRCFCFSVTKFQLLLFAPIHSNVQHNINEKSNKATVEMLQTLDSTIQNAMQLRIWRDCVY